MRSQPATIDPQTFAGGAGGRVRMEATVHDGGRSLQLQGEGNGPVDAFVAAVAAATGQSVRVLDYHEHAIGSGAQARAAAYLELRVGESQTMFGVGIDGNIVTASLQAVLSGLRRAGVPLRALLSEAA